MWSSSSSWAQQFADAAKVASDAAKAASDAASKMSMDDFAQNLEKITNLDKLMADDDTTASTVIGTDGDYMVISDIKDNIKEKKITSTINNNNNDNDDDKNTTNQQEILIHQLQDLLRSNDNELTIIKDNYKKLYDDHNDANNTISNMTTILTNKETELLSINNTIILLKSSLEQYENDKNNNIIIIDQLQSSLEQVENDKKIAINNVKDYDKLKKANDKLNEQVDTLKKSLKSKDNEISKLQSRKNSKATPEKVDIIAGASSSSSLSSSLSDNKLKELEDVIQKLKEEKTVFEEKNEELLNSLNQVEEGKARVEKEHQELEQEVDKLKVSLSSSSSSSSSSSLP